MGKGFTRVLWLAFANWLFGLSVQVALVCKGMTIGLGVGARALSAGNAVQGQAGFPIVSIQAHLTVETSGGGLAVDAFAGAWIAGGCMAIALAGLAVGEVPEPRLALVALAAVGFLVTIALAIDLVAEGVQRANVMAVAGCGWRSPDNTQIQPFITNIN